VPEVPLASADIRRYLDEVAAALEPAGRQHTLVLVGGSLLALHGLRDTTADVDTIGTLDDELHAAVAVVAVRHGLAPKWLNASAAAFTPATFSVADCDLLLEHPRLRVLGAPWPQVFVMKLFAGRAQDRDDLVAIWPRAGFTSPTAAAALYREAYPHEREDEYLVDYIRAIADEAQ
jgi:hypothetical protein